MLANLLVQPLFEELVREMIQDASGHPMTGPNSHPIFSDSSLLGGERGTQKH